MRVRCSRVQADEVAHPRGSYAQVERHERAQSQSRRLDDLVLHVERSAVFGRPIRSAEVVVTSRRIVAESLQFQALAGDDDRAVDLEEDADGVEGRRHRFVHAPDGTGVWITSPVLSPLAATVARMDDEEPRFADEDDDYDGSDYAEPRFMKARRMWWDIRRWSLNKLLPDQVFVGDDQLTHSARMLLRRLAFGVLIIAFGVGAILLMNRDNREAVAAGALLAWTVSGMVWAISSYKANQDVVAADLRRYAELDVLHARLNQIAAKVGAPVVNLIENELDFAIQARLDRVAHLSGLEEFGRYDENEDGQAFWDDAALGLGGAPTDSG